eukprot:3770477-Pyramimonas_sp.AAC.1
MGLSGTLARPSRVGRQPAAPRFGPQTRWVSQGPQRGRAAPAIAIWSGRRTPHPACTPGGAEFAAAALPPTGGGCVSSYCPACGPMGCQGRSRCRSGRGRGRANPPCPGPRGWEA